MKIDKVKILNLLYEVCEKECPEIVSLHDMQKLSDIGFDSLRFISFVVKLEEAFNIEINDSDLLYEKFETLDKLFDTLGKYFDKQAIMKKCLVLDCDNVLWKGVSGEEKIIIDSDVKKLHELLLTLKRQGILLCLCSKSEPEFIAESFAEPEMKLKLSDFVAVRINRRDKAVNLLEIENELNLSSDSFVFADDSDYELGYVRAALPQVHSVKVDYSDLYFLDAIRTAFAETSVSELDRTKLYREQKEREKEKSRFSSTTQYNASLNTVVICCEAQKDEIPRLAELSQRTNQFNLSDRHYSEDEIAALFTDTSIKIISLSVQDKYGDMGLVGMAVLRNDTIEAFMLSCRVFDRGFENILLDKIKNLAGSMLFGVFRSNEKNKRFQNFYPENGVKSV